MLYRFLRGVFRLMFSVMFRLKAEGRENIPKEGAVVLCANHTSNWDPPVLGSLLERKVHYMAKAELFELPVLKQVLPRIGAFPVKRGGVSKDSIRLSLQLLKNGEIIGVFPEGTRSNAGGMGKKGAASLALKSGATVIPAAIIGNYSLFRPMKVVYGPAVDISEFADAGSEGLEQATDKIMTVIREMVRRHESK
ncbi:lysophospholipid acyltransferase family protein [Paenibacillus validus]|uniref:1-acyl-sn-glycerol-3-phosphate acyltransferase n=1 Tax=Paenibacillus validus TaxID=44253 RepID=A0A7X2ZB53_9BACL|nr:MULTISPECIES: lysophospholipid acyltransferase family protein [Paenibacillus]MED4601434.1 lysophospholipid acyltransferase family protein [Paenibacillus validus]MED4607773.1 lysophospholipid acyltransferase family protein [Paenibacillus validus]MUG71700.1 1-acyl-sn-glycerol-3-phosphate acyltransferase [Paenibacillus validus]